MEQSVSKTDKNSLQLDRFLKDLLSEKEIVDLEEKYKTINYLKAERKPVDLNEFIFSKDYIGLDKISPKQAKFLLALDDMNPETCKYREFVIVVGKGGGKDLCSALANLRFCYRLVIEGPPSDYAGASLGLPITVLNVATNAEQASSVYFETFKTLGRNIFKKLGCKVKTNEVEFPDKIFAVSGHSEAEGMEGYNLFSCVLDEIAAFKTERELKGRSLRAKQSAKYLYDMAKTSIRSRFPKTGKLILISYPRFAGDFILQKYEEGKLRDDVYTEFAKTWEFNPYVSEEDFVDEKQRDYVQYLAKYECRPPKAKEAYFQDEIKIRRIVDINLPNPYTDLDRLNNNFLGRNFYYYCGLDLAIRHDRAAFAMCHKDRGDIAVDILKVWSAPELGGEINFEDIRKFIFLLKDRNFAIKKVLVDTFQSADTIQILNHNNIPAENESADRGLKVYDTLKDVIYRGKLKCVNCKYTPLLIEELLGLSLINGRKVDHLSDGSKDVSDALALAVYAAATDNTAAGWVRYW